MNQQRDMRLLEGSIIGSLLRLAGPIVFANILQSAYQLTDTFWVGRLGAEAVAAVSISFPIIFLMISLGAGGSMAGSILIAQYAGRGDHEQANYYASQTLVAVVLLTVVVSVIGYIFTDPMLGLLQVEPAVFEAAADYLRATFIGFTFMLAFFVFQALLRGVGDVTTPMYIVLGTVLLNLILDPLFIMGFGPIPALGVAGAAWATLGTQGLAGIIGIAILFSGRMRIRIEPRFLIPNFAAMQKIIKLGLPASIEQSVRALGMSFMIVLVTGFGTIPVAVYGIGTRILSFVIIPALGFSMATSTLVGQNIGAGNQERAKKIANLSAWIAFISLTVIGMLAFFFAENLIAAFIPDDRVVIEQGTLFLQIIALSFGFIGIQQVLNGAFRGAGNTLAAMALAILTLWVLQFPMAYGLSHFTSQAEVGIWWSFPLANVIAAVIAILWFRFGKWMRLVTDDPKKLKFAESTG